MENHGKTIGKPWEKGKPMGKPIGEWRFTLNGKREPKNDGTIHHAIHG